jgi:PAS domain S-box-containing protein
MRRPRSNPPARPVLPRPWLGALAWGTAFGIGALWLVVGAVHDRAATLHDARETLDSRAQIAAAQVTRLAEEADVALRTAALLVGPHPDWAMVSRDRALWQGLRDVSALMPSVPRLLLTDPNGTVVLHTDIFPAPMNSVADRDYFPVASGHPEGGLAIGLPLIGRTSNVPALPFARAMVAPDGTLLGVAISNLDPSVFQGFLRPLVQHGRKTRFALRRGDGALLVRYPEGGTETAAGLPADPAQADPTRIVAVRRLDRFNLVVVAEQPVEAALAPWRRKTQQMAVVGLGVAVIVTLALVLLVRRRRAEREALRRLAHSEANLRRAQTVGRIGNWQTDFRTGETVWSDETYRIFGVGSDVTVGLPLALSLSHPDDRALVLEATEGALRRGGFDVEHRIIVDGHVVWVAVKAEVETDSDGHPTGIFGTIQDVSDRRRAEEDLRCQGEELVRSNTELEQFAYVASHDLREPLRMISAYVDLLARRYGDRLDPEAHEFIAFARDGAARMDRLVLDLLDYSRIGRKAQPLRPVGLDGSLDRALNVLTLKIEAAGAVIDRPEGGLPTVIGDSGELARLFQNLIDNALKYRDTERPLRVTIRAVAQGPLWEVAVSDTGIGIAAEYFERIFRIFQRLHTRQTIEGTGIGLAICKKIVERHGGRISVESAPGVGSTFRFTLPAADPTLP